jgi:hypothetical protein
MEFMRRFCRHLIIAVLLLLGSPIARVAANTGIQTLTEYFDLLESGNLETAEYLWMEAAQERSGRFGIEYIGIPLKIDCTSPIVQNFEEMRDYLRPPVKQYEDLEGPFQKLEYSAVVGEQSVRHFYYVQLSGGDYWLTYPQDYYGRDWPAIESRYFHINYHPTLEPYLHPAILSEIDAFVEQAADSLDIEDETLEMIADKKIEYYYCESDMTVKAICGYLTRGLLDLASNDIISAAFPHFHEIARLLVNIKLQRLDLYALPLLREGLAVRYGGRWGKNASALMDLGVFLYKEQLVQLDSILTYDGFLQSSGADISYPVAGLFVTFLMDKMGQESFFDLYREASGTNEEIASWDRADVQDIVIRYTGHEDWRGLQADFSDFMEERVAKRLYALPGSPKQGRVVVEEGPYRVTQYRDWFVFEFTGDSEGPPKGNLLFGHSDDLAGRRSRLFDEQYQGQREYEGYRFGIRYDQYEVGLYDYVTNQLVAKYIWGITPSDDYFDREKNKISIRFRENLVDGYLSRGVHCKWLPD